MSVISHTVGTWFEPLQQWPADSGTATLVGSGPIVEKKETLRHQ